MSLALLAAHPAGAIPSAANSRIPSHILLVGRTGALADTAVGAFTVVVHDAANAPVFNSTVEARILNCPGARLSSVAYDPGSSIRCGTHGVQESTDANGEVRMTVVGAGTPGAPAGAGLCVQFYASSVPLGFATLAYLDLDGSGGLGANDVALWLADFGSGEDIGRSDFDGDSHLSVADLSVWLAVWGEAGSFESPASYCP
jgi:hypothetical protein